MESNLTEMECGEELKPLFPMIEPFKVTKPGDFWRGLEVISTGAATLRDWTWAFEGTTPLVRPFLRATGGRSSVMVCPTNACSCVHTVSETERWGLIAACSCEDWECETLRIQPDDVAIYELERELLGDAIVRALGLGKHDAARYEGPGLYEIGRCAEAAAPVYLAMGDYHSLMRGIGKVTCVREGPFLLLTPTGSSCEQDVERLLQQHGAGHISLSSVLEVRMGTRGVEFVPNGAAAASLRAFVERVTKSRGGGTVLASIHREIASVGTQLAELRVESGRAGEGGEAARVESRPRYLLRKGLQGWQLVFDGKETVLWDEKAVTYVSVLLLDPPAEPIHGSELAHRAFGDAVVEDQRNLAMDDADTAREMATARRRCQAVIDDDGASEVERQEARTELEEIQEWAQKHLRGTEGNEQRQVRAIRQNIRRFLEKLHTAQNAQGEPDEVLRAFGEHLERYLWRASGAGARGRRARVRSGLAGRFTYEPPAGVKWSG